MATAFASFTMNVRRRHPSVGFLSSKSRIARRSASVIQWSRGTVALCSLTLQRLRQLGDHLVLLGHPGLQRLDGAAELGLLGVTIVPRKGGGAVLEEGLLPIVKLAWAEVELIAQCGDWALLGEVQA